MRDFNNYGSTTVWVKSLLHVAVAILYSCLFIVKEVDERQIYNGAKIE